MCAHATSRPGRLGVALPAAITLVVAMMVFVAPTLASPPVARSTPSDGTEPDDTAAPSPAASGRTVVVPNLRPQAVNRDRASSIVTRQEMQERLPHSAPDALTYEPGVYVQRSAHAQASPYIRGLTGQQTLLTFDGIRLNNATFRAGPNQYFFTVDSRTIQRLEVLRGSASTQWGSDAIGGALLSTPMDPSMERVKREFHGWQIHPRLSLAARSADGEIGGRVQLDTTYRRKLGFIGGMGYRKAGFLETSGPILAPATGKQHKSPRFAKDQRTQLGTGFSELTGDARLVYRPDPNFKFTLAYYDYRQMDAPRTDKCPADEAPEDQCLIYLEQFRTLTYAALDTHAGPALAQNGRVTASFQKQHERKQLTRDNGIPEIDGGTQNNGRDDVYTLGGSVRVSTRTWALGNSGEYRLDYGGDIYHDMVKSDEWLVFTDLSPQVVRTMSRGQYVDGSSYLSSGLYAQNKLRFWDLLSLRGGGRLAYIAAQARRDDESTTRGIDRRWTTAVANMGIAVEATPWLSLLSNVDQGFRAPNLDDLTSRQQTGPGFQFENSELIPERSLTYESGFKIRNKHIEASAFVYQTNIHNYIARSPRTIDDCPEGDSGGCESSASLFQLVNLGGAARIRGFDGAVRIFFGHGISVNTSIAYAHGAGQNPVARPANADLVSNYARRVPLSRIPPLNGTAELTWRAHRGVWLGGGMRWATAQDRLAPADVADVRIPAGGTPGFAVFDLRAGYRWDPFLLLGVVFENVGDSPYRYHGSSVNGAARSIRVSAEVGF